MFLLCWSEIGSISINDLFPPLSLAAHTPDNSFMGFVAEELNETERLAIQRNKLSNMAVVYGKEASMWKVSFRDGLFHFKTFQMNWSRDVVDGQIPTAAPTDT